MIGKRLKVFPCSSCHSSCNWQGWQKDLLDRQNYSCLSPQKIDKQLCTSLTSHHVYQHQFYLFFESVPVPPPLPDASAPLQVKRLNWETHNPEQIDKTVWGRWKSTDHLEIGDLVESLELAQQFSTVKKKPGMHSPRTFTQSDRVGFYSHWAC